MARDRAVAHQAVDPAGGPAVDLDLDRPRAGAAEGEPERCPAVRLIIEVEGDSEGRRPAVAADAGVRDRPGVRVLVVRDVLEEPVLAEVALADHVVHVIEEQPGVLQRNARVSIFPPFEEFRAVPVGYPHLPEGLAMANGRPWQLAQVERLARLDGDIGLRVLAEQAIGERVQGVAARADIRDGEAALIVAARPELVVLGVGLPVDESRRAGRRHELSATRRRGARGRPGGWASMRRVSAGRPGRAGHGRRRDRPAADNRRPRPSRTASAPPLRARARPRPARGPAGRRRS